MTIGRVGHHSRRFGYSYRQNEKYKTFNKRKNRALLTLLRSQKHYVIFSKNVLRENITRKRFTSKGWLGLVSIFQTAFGYLVMRTQSKY